MSLRTNRKTRGIFSLYHGTSTANAKKIIKSGELRPSSPLPNMPRETLGGSRRIANIYAQQDRLKLVNGKLKYLGEGEKGKVLHYEVPEEVLDEYFLFADDFQKPDWMEHGYILKKPLPNKYLVEVTEGEGR